VIPWGAKGYAPATARTRCHCEERSDVAISCFGFERCYFPSEGKVTKGSLRGLGEEQVLLH
jgi:hypothetical protein